MFGNLINRNDLLSLLDKAIDGGLPKILRMFGKNSDDRVRAAWEEGQPPISTFWDVPKIRERLYRFCSGDRGVDHIDYFINNYLADSRGKKSLHGISIGCGLGLAEIRLARSAAFHTFDAWDISPEQIAMAGKTAADAGLDDVVKFRAAPALRISASPNSYDAAFGIASLHHFWPVSEIARSLNEWLKPGGLLFIFEYVGPARLQWTTAQTDIVNRLLETMPDHLKTRANGRVKRRVQPPGLLKMWMADPSEAIDSERIMESLQSRFETVEVRKLGGAILHPLFHQIAHNFASGSDEAVRVLEECFKAEDEAMKAGIIGSDFVMAIFRKKRDPD